MKIALQWSLQLENLTELSPAGEDFRWYFKFKCLSCGEVTSEFVYLSQEQNQSLKGDRGCASIVIKCKLCSRSNSCDLQPATIKAYRTEDSAYSTLLVLDCRGLEPVEWSPRAGFTAKGLDEAGEPSGSELSVDLSEGAEWYDVDERTGLSVSVSELEVRFTKTK